MRGQREVAGQHAHTENPAQPRWRRVFPGEDRQLGVLREWLRELLPECAAREDVILVASELGANALCHTASGRGGQFSVEVTTVQIIVGDGGGAGEPRIIDDPDSENGRGLWLVQALSAAMSVTGDERGRFVRADVPWAANGGPESREGAWDWETTADLRTPHYRIRMGGSGAATARSGQLNSDSATGEAEVAAAEPSRPAPDACA